MTATLGEIASRTWDYIIIGTGVGGGTLGYSLSRGGRSVLFLERGSSHQGMGGPLLDDYPERLSGDNTATTLAAGGRYPDHIIDASGDQPYSFTPFIGTGTGGSSALYGMALERFFEQDFSPAAQHRASSAVLPERWPVSYRELSSHYQAAERLYQVRGATDPLRPGDLNAHLPPPELSAPNAELFEFFQQGGLHPYRLPMACEFTGNCATCQGYLCSRACKNDSSRICLQPALERYNAELLDNCEVVRIEADNNAVTQLQCQHKNKPLQLRARNYVLAAGALESPRLLLASASRQWPQGLGNNHDQVGRYLMRHYIDLYAVFTRARFTGDDLVKQIAFNDLYQRDGEKLGSVQSFGLLPPAELLVQDIQRDLAIERGALMASLFGVVKPLVAATLGRMLGKSVLLASTLEDLPFAENTVRLPDNPAQQGHGRLVINYRPGAGEQARIERFRDEMAALLKPYKYLHLKQAENNQRIAHACGTCRFGNDPAASVCDADHRVHGINNLYIADSSVFPSSGGINPSLTIAALSLRLAARLGAGLHD